jgi:hypothetical protein
LEWSTRHAKEYLYSYKTSCFVDGSICQEFTHAAFIRFRLRHPAARMNSQLGGWPGFYGDDGLSQQVIVHANVAQWLFTVVLLAALAMPLLILSKFFSIVESV